MVIEWQLCWQKQGLRRAARVLCFIKYFNSDTGVLTIQSYRTQQDSCSADIKSDILYAYQSGTLMVRGQTGHKIIKSKIPLILEALYNLISHILLMNTLFLTLPVSHPRSSEKLSGRQLIEEHIEAIRQIAKYLKTLDPDKLKMIVNRLRIDKTVYKIIDDFSTSDARDAENNQSLEKLQRKLVLLKLLQGQSKRLVNENRMSEQVQKAKKPEGLEESRAQAIKQLNYRILVDKHKEDKAIKKKQLFLKERTQNIRSHNSYKKSITSKHKEREKQEIERIVESKKKETPADYSIWNRGSLESKKRMAFTSIIKYRIKRPIRVSHDSEARKDQALNKNNKGSCSGSCLLNKSKSDHFKYSNSKRKQFIDKQFQKQQLSKAVQKLMKIEDIKERKKGLKKIKNEGLEINRNNNTFDDTFEQQQRIFTKLNEKLNNKQNFLRERSMKIHQQLELKKVKLDRLKANEHERYLSIEKENQNLSRRQAPKNQNDLPRQNYIRHRHNQAIARNKNKEQVINIVHSSNSQLYRHLLKDLAQNND